MIKVLGWDSSHKTYPPFVTCCVLCVPHQPTTNPPCSVCDFKIIKNSIFDYLVTERRKLLRCGFLCRVKYNFTSICEYFTVHSALQLRSEFFYTSVACIFPVVLRAANLQVAASNPRNSSESLRRLSYSKCSQAKQF